MNAYLCYASGTSDVHTELYLTLAKFNSCLTTNRTVVPSVF